MSDITSDDFYQNAADEGLVCEYCGCLAPAHTTNCNSFKLKDNLIGEPEELSLGEMHIKFDGYLSEEEYKSFMAALFAQNYGNNYKLSVIEI